LRFRQCEPASGNSWSPGTMAVTVPSWFKGRQGKAEEAGPHVLRLTGPNLNEWHVGIRRAENGRWLGFVRKSPDGPDTSALELGERATEYEAWEAAFELYRNQVII
jgi:hypothetical protein